MPQAPDTGPLPSSQTPPTLTIDWEVYAALLDDSDMPIHQQRELIETLWSIALMFVDLGFGLNPVQQICGEDTDLSPDNLVDLLSYGEQDRIGEEAPWTK